MTKKQSTACGTIEAARLLAASRRKLRKVCVECGAAFEGLARRKFCSNRCYTRAYRRKRAQAGPESSGGQSA